MISQNYLESAKKQFLYYKLLADKTLLAVPDEKINWQFNEESNSIGIIIQHMAGNMLSRFTDFLTTDGEKEWRNRDIEFERSDLSKTDLLKLWNNGWRVLINTLDNLQPADLDTIVYIRNEGHTVMEAINRQLAHYPYHVGQIIFLGKMIAADKWVSLSIPKGKSGNYNEGKFENPKKRAHFTDSIINDDKLKG